MRLIQLFSASLLLLTTNVMSANMKGFYVGAGVGMESLNSELFDEDPLIGATLKAGYGIHKYFGVEFRAERTLVAGDKLEHPYSIAAYAKPQYSISRNWNVYGLVGYGQNQLAYPDEELFNGNKEDTTTVSGLSYGAGIEYRMTDRLAFFVEGLQLINDSETIDGSDFAINELGVYAGVSYYFGARAKPKPKLKTTIKYSATPQKIRILFDSGKWDIKPQYHVELINYANFMKNNPEAFMDIIGHTDSRSSASYNQILSRNRAVAIKQFIVKRGVKSIRIKAIGMGENEPVATNKTKAGRLLNRRIEAKVYRKK